MTDEERYREAIEFARGVLADHVGRKMPSVVVNGLYAILTRAVTPPAENPTT